MDSNTGVESCVMLHHIIHEYFQTPPPAWIAASPSCRLALEASKTGYSPCNALCITRSSELVTVEVLQPELTSDITAAIHAALWWLDGPGMAAMRFQSQVLSGKVVLPEEATRYIREIDLSQCARLTSLRLEGSTAPRLETVDLTNCEFLRELHGPSRTPQLKRLKASKVDLTYGLHWMLNSCTLLREMDLSYTPVDLPPLSTSLRSLNLSKSPISSLTEVQYCTALESLDITSCGGVTNFAPLRNLAHLRVVRAARTKMQDVMWVTSCRNLEVLDVSHNEQLTDLSPVAALLNLRELRTQHTPITNAQWIIRCRSLCVLDLSYCDRLSGVLPVDRLPHLVELHLPFSLPHESLACLATDGFPELRILDFTWKTMEPRHKKKKVRGEYLSRLTKLEMSGCHVSTKFVQECISLRHFRAVEMPSIKYELLRSISHSMRSMWIGHPADMVNVRPTDLDWLRNFSSLTELHIINLIPERDAEWPALSECALWLEKLELCHMPLLETIEWALDGPHLMHLSVLYCPSVEIKQKGFIAGMLTKLELCGLTKLVDVEWLSRLPRLEELRLDGCHNLTDINALERRQASLRVVSLVDTSITTARPISMCALLEKLDVSGCGQLTDLSSIHKCTKLEELRLARSAVRRLGMRLAACTNLRIMNVRDCHHLRDLDAATRRLMYSGKLQFE